MYKERLKQQLKERAKTKEKIIVVEKAQPRQSNANIWAKSLRWILVIC